MLVRRAVVPAFLCFSACAAPHAPARPAHVPEPRATPPLDPSRRAPAAVPPATTRPIPELDRPWGTAGPVSLVAASPERRWLAFCQARTDTDGDGRIETRVGARGEVTGDRMDGFFADGPGEGDRIDAWGGADPSGRFVAFVKDGRLVLRDTTTQVDTILDADLRDDRSPFGHPRFVAFDPSGARMLYAVRDGSPGVRVRELGTGAEVRLDGGGGELYRADFDPTGNLVLLTMSPADSNGNGRVDWPVPEAKAPWMRCSAPLPSYPVWERPTDDLAVRVAKVDGGPPSDVRGLVVPLGAGLVVRAPDGALELVTADGKRAPLVKKECAAHVLHADPGRGFLVATCAKKKGSHSDLLLVRASSTVPLGLEVSGTFGDRWMNGAPPLVPLYPGPNTVLLDADHGTTEALTPGDRVLGGAGTRVLVERGTRLLFHELGGGEVALPGETSPLARLVRTGGVLLVPPLVVNVERGELVGTTPLRALAISLDGSVLAPERDADSSAFALGPLRWHAPGPPPADAR